VTADAVEQRGLACTVRTDQAEDDARLDVEADLLEHLDAAEVQADLGEAEACGHLHSPLASLLGSDAIDTTARK
jgi:hypothetical protein